VVGPGRPVLRLVETGPPIFRGLGFKPHEHVTVVFVGPARALGRAVASGVGAFTLRLAGVEADACVGFSATATGDDGSRAVFRSPRAQCALP
jgi:hypothetical protein